ncbi:MAG: S41 family peptidase [Planctomycetota bacterium]|nr:S41 family peptidase [Planctomycetota bacterium]
MMRAALLLFLSAAAFAAPRKSVYVEDMEFALKALEKECGHFFKQKGIDWKPVRKEFLKSARKAKNLQDHYILLIRLLARLRDGHASVRTTAFTKTAQYPDLQLRRGAGLFFCRNGKKIYVKNAWSNAGRAGIRAGMEVVKIDGTPAGKWLDMRVETLSDVIGFSTPQHALFFTCHWGLGGAEGSRVSLELRTRAKKSKKVTVMRGKASVVPSGPVVYPKGLTRAGRQSYGKTRDGWGYIHLRDVPRNMLVQMDTMLKALDNPPGLILDCRANGGGGTDHDALLGRFVLKGRKLRRAKAYPIPSAGETPYGGPVVVIVDAGVRSAGETVSGMFKEDGRAYMIGESPTAGMSSSKKTIELPSKLFSLYVSVRSNKARFQGGRGIEGIGIIPHEVLPYDPEDLAAGRDTLIRRAAAILGNFPKGRVPYRPEKQGWKRD